MVGNRRDVVKAVRLDEHDLQLGGRIVDAHDAIGVCLRAWLIMHRPCRLFFLFPAGVVIVIFLVVFPYGVVIIVVVLIHIDDLLDFLHKAHVQKPPAFLIDPRTEKRGADTDQIGPFFNGLDIIAGHAH